MRSSRLTFAVFAAAAALCAQPMPGGPGRGGMMGPWRGGRAVVTGAPYSAVETTEIQAGAQNTAPPNRQAKVYRDSQGRVRYESTSTDRSGQTRSFITIFDPVAGLSYMLNPETKTAMKNVVHTPPAEAQREGGPAQETQPQKEDLGTQTINGLAATGTRTTRTIPAGLMGNQGPVQIIRESWTSTDLKVPILVKTTDPRFGTSTMQLTNISQAEPDPGLFQVPADYTVTEGRPGRQGGMVRHQDR